MTHVQGVLCEPNFAVFCGIWGLHKLRGIANALIAVGTGCLPEAKLRASPGPPTPVEYCTVVPVERGVAWRRISCASSLL